MSEKVGQALETPTWILVISNYKSRRKPLSHRNFAMKFAPYVYIWTMKNHNSGNFFFNVVPFQNGGQITDFCFASGILILAKI